MEEDIKKNVLKTGTTTIGLVCKDGIVLAADKRGTYGGDSGVSYIASRDHDKIKQINENMIVTIAGVSSDIQKVIKIMRAELRLKELRTKSKPTVKEAANLFSNIVYQNIRQFSPIPAITHFLLAGNDDKNIYLYEISADGLLEEIKDYAATGSGMIQVNPILDSEYTKELTVEQAIKLAKKCINASMNRDPGSGGGIDIFVVKPSKIEQVTKQEAVVEYKDIK